jgi:hypothetical protein
MLVMPSDKNLLSDWICMQWLNQWKKVCELQRSKNSSSMSSFKLQSKANNLSTNKRMTIWITGIIERLLQARGGLHCINLNKKRALVGSLLFQVSHPSLSDRLLASDMLLVISGGSGTWFVFVPFATHFELLFFGAQTWVLSLCFFFSPLAECFDEWSSPRFHGRRVHKTLRANIKSINKYFFDSRKMPETKLEIAWMLPDLNPWPHKIYIWVNVLTSVGWFLMFKKNLWFRV